MRHSEKVIIMKRILLILILMFSFQSLTKADDIGDFQIEGMSIGDSLLKYFDDLKIISNTVKKNKYKSKRYTYLMLDDENNDYKFETYDAVYIHYQTKDRKYIIHGISGILSFKNNINKCYTKMDTIDVELSDLFKSLNISKGSIHKHSIDETGKSTIKSNSYKSLDGWLVDLQCFDWSEEMGYHDHLRITIRDKDFAHFMSNEAYK